MFARAAALSSRRRITSRAFQTFRAVQDIAKQNEVPEEKLPGLPYLSAGFHLTKAEVQKPPISTICVEEHYSIPHEYYTKYDLPHSEPGYPDSMPMMQYSTPRMALTEGMRDRLRDMDRGNITMQILSATGHVLSTDPGVNISFAKDVNDYVASQIKNSDAPDRFGAFAFLPLVQPTDAADELERCVRDHGMLGTVFCGQVRGKFLDDPQFIPLLTKAQSLGVPIYIHPSFPPLDVMNAYYRGLPGASGGGLGPLGTILASCGFGWHAEAAIHILRLVLSGTLEMFPSLKIITGHHGQMLPMMMQRMDNLFDGLLPGSRTVTETLRQQLYVSFSGMYTLPNVQIAIKAFGVDHIMWSCDYPWLPAEDTKHFLGVLHDSLHPEDLRKIAQTNAQNLLGITVSAKKKQDLSKGHFQVNCHLDILETPRLTLCRGAACKQC